MMNKIARKPVPQPRSNLKTIPRDDDLEKAPTLPPRVLTDRTKDIKQENLHDTLPSPNIAPSVERHDSSISNAPLTPTSSTTPSKWKSFLDETAHFAGGLVSHPFSSTKHYTILRHSGPIIYYKGPSTRLVISIFSDSLALPPPDRTFWLQRKGFSGSMGMAIAANSFMRTATNWIDVTPSTEVLASSVPKNDERAWERDIKKFTKKGAKDKRLSKHIVRETCVLRLPAAAADGYLRVVMCTGATSKKTLCTSPTFRLASTSSDVSVLRGASFRTLPLEASLKVASIAGNSYVQGIIGTAQSAIQGKIDAMKPAVIASGAGAAAVSVATGAVTDEVAAYDEEHFDAEADVGYDPFDEQGVVDNDKPPDVIGSDEGPEDPFPISLRGKVVPGTGNYKLDPNGVPTANLSGVPADLLLRLGGIYIGWAAIESESNKATSPKTTTKSADPLSKDWHEAIITIGPSPHASPNVAMKNVATVHIIHDFGPGTSFFDSKLKVMIMALLRPIPRRDPSAIISPDLSAYMTADKTIAIASLSREMWQHGIAIEVLASRGAKTTGEKYAAFRSNMQRRVDSIPLHLAGVRTDRGEIRDLAHGKGGFYIKR
ncbi:hypothetical protein F5Y16DRAFT_310638 [Xylariaceae sp. FL0255]|nr:hypothetical protein F5Y16DRAFT_310638 [Xylariaceae sp. FL0255]